MIFTLKDKVVLVRVDFNSEIDPATKKGHQRCAHSSPRRNNPKRTRGEVLKPWSAHQKAEKGDPDYTPLKQHAEILGKILKCPVKYVDVIFGASQNRHQKPSRRRNSGLRERAQLGWRNQERDTRTSQQKTELVQNLAPLADLFVNDAFAAAHRGHVSMVGFTAVLPSAAGRIMERELKSLSKALEKPEKPCVYVMGGAKADDSLDAHILSHLISSSYGHCFGCEHRRRQRPGVERSVVGDQGRAVQGDGQPGSGAGARVVGRR